MKLKDRLEKFEEEIGKEELSKLIGYSSIRAVLMSFQDGITEFADEEVIKSFEELIRLIEDKWTECQEKQISKERSVIE